MRQSDLAEKSEIKNYMMSFIENKKILPNPEIAEKIAEILCVPVGALWNEYELELIRQK